MTVQERERGGRKTGVSTLVYLLRNGFVRSLEQLEVLVFASSVFFFLDKNDSSNRGGEGQM